MEPEIKIRHNIINIKDRIENIEKITNELNTDNREDTENKMKLIEYQCKQIKSLLQLLLENLKKI